MAVIVLVDGAVAGIRVPGLAVLVEAGVVGFVELKHRVLALPGPHGRGGLPQPGAFLGVDPVVDLRGDVFGHVPLDQGLVAIHGSNTVAADVPEEAVLNENAGVAVGLYGFIRQVQSGKMLMGVAVARGNAPAAAALYPAMGDVQVFITGDFPVFLLRLLADAVDAAVSQVLVIDVALHIVDVESRQGNAVKGAPVLGHHRHAGAVHFVPLVVPLSRQETGVIGNFQVPEADVFAVI